ncbi:PSD1 and planctomycete cytochrome C domain-containing protein [Haloferula sp.]|uniref:PSD1 and planctomycete cytochrome C domain-containing protein n=1 Tax=Haloferula sp. TaxID=2497595 RepID=UPI00329DCAEE
MTKIRQLLFLAWTLPLSAAVDFEKEIKPILDENCLDCHGPEKERSALRVDQRGIMLKGGDSGLPAVVPGSPEESYLLEVVDGRDPDTLMPPKGDPLTSGQVALIETWIKEGAEWPGQMDQVAETTTDHWSFQEVVRPEVPAGSSNPVDAFLDRSLKEAGVAPNPQSDARSLIRRASIVLTGLPPTPEGVAAFEQAFATNEEKAYESLVDELMDSDHFGERWAQHWLDVIRWAETNGSEANLYRKGSWTYRDYVVRSFNSDLPYDQFVTEQLAGDQLGVGEATGFLVAGPHVPASTVGREPSAIRQARADRVDEVMQTVGASMLGVTVSCARCHNHKFDPISIRDYYSLTAVFQGVEFGGRRPEMSDGHPRKMRAAEVHQELKKARKVLREGSGIWEESWGGYVDMAFPATTTRVLRVEFDSSRVRLDEVDVFGPVDFRKNLALASEGTILLEDPELADKGSNAWRANDGEYGTMVWHSSRPKGSKKKPWLEIWFSEPEEINRFRLSTNREYYFETDYLESDATAFPSYKLLVQQTDGNWSEVASTKAARLALIDDPAVQASSARLHEQIKVLDEEGPRHSFIGQFKKPVVTHIFHRGSPENPRDEVPPAGFEVLGGDLGLDSRTPDPERRLAFAEWITRPEHPLTARVMVNRIWHHMFGSGIVPTGSDFGLAGAAPSHPELLDWLAAEFVDPENGPAWSMKSVIRRLAITDAFRRSSLPTEEGLEADAGAMLLWRYPPQRVEAEVVRDAILQASGKLDTSLGGRSFRIHNVKKTYAQWQVVDNHGPETWRRMLYQERMRRVDDRIFTAFDFPDCGQVRAKRPVSTTPLQALNLMNSPFVVEQSGYIAERAINESNGDTKDAVRRAFALILGRPADAQELEDCREIADTNGLAIVCRSLLNSNEFAFLP